MLEAVRTVQSAPDSCSLAATDEQEWGETRIAGALQAGQLDEVLGLGPGGAAGLLAACESDETIVASRARIALARVAQPRMRDEVCRLALYGDYPKAYETIRKANLTPADPDLAILHYFAGGNIERYLPLDRGGQRLRGYYETATPPLRRKMADAARQHGLLSWVSMVIEGSLASLEHAEWEALGEILGGVGRWEELWQALQQAPAVWCAPTLLCLAREGYTPSAPGEKESFEHLLSLARECGRWEDAVRDWIPREATTSRTAEGAVVDALVIGSGDQLLLAGGHSVTVLHLPGAGAETVRVLSSRPYRIHSFTVSPDGRQAAAGVASGGIQIWRLSDGATRAPMDGLAVPARHLCYSPDSRRLAAAAPHDTTVYLWRLDGEELPLLLSGHSTEVVALAPWQEAGALVSVDDQGWICLWNFDNGALIARLKGAGENVAGLAVGSDGLLAAGGADGMVRLISLPDGEDAGVLRGHTAPVTSVAISPDGTVLVSGDESGVLRFWSLPEGEAQQVFRGHAGRVRRLQAPSGGEFLLSADAEGIVRFWSFLDGAPFATLDRRAAAAETAAETETNTASDAGAEWTERFARIVRTPVDALPSDDVDYAMEQLGEIPTESSARPWLELLVALFLQRQLCPADLLLPLPDDLLAHSDLGDDDFLGLGSWSAPPGAEALPQPVSAPGMAAWGALAAGTTGDSTSGELNAASSPAAQSRAAAAETWRPARVVRAEHERMSQTAAAGSDQAAADTERTGPEAAPQPIEASMLAALGSGTEQNHPPAAVWSPRATTASEPMPTITAPAADIRLRPRFRPKLAMPRPGAPSAV